MKTCMDETSRHNMQSIYMPMDELWYPRWYVSGVNVEKENAPWRYKKGYNRALGDKWLFFKG